MGRVKKTNPSLWINGEFYFIEVWASVPVYWQGGKLTISTAKHLFRYDDLAERKELNIDLYSSLLEKLDSPKLEAEFMQFCKDKPTEADQVSANIGYKLVTKIRGVPDKFLHQMTDGEYQKVLDHFAKARTAKGKIEHIIRMQRDVPNIIISSSLVEQLVTPSENYAENVRPKITDNPAEIEAKSEEWDGLKKEVESGELLFNTNNKLPVIKHKQEEGSIAKLPDKEINAFTGLYGADAEFILLTFALAYTLQGQTALDSGIIGLPKNIVNSLLMGKTIQGGNTAVVSRKGAQAAELSSPFILVVYENIIRLMNNLPDDAPVDYNQVSRLQDKLNLYDKKKYLYRVNDYMVRTPYFTKYDIVDKDTGKDLASLLELTPHFAYGLVNDFRCIPKDVFKLFSGKTRVKDIKVRLYTWLMTGNGKAYIHKEKESLLIMLAGKKEYYKNKKRVLADYDEAVELMKSGDVIIRYDEPVNRDGKLISKFYFREVRTKKKVTDESETKD